MSRKLFSWSDNGQHTTEEVHWNYMGFTLSDYLYQ